MDIGIFRETLKTKNIGKSDVHYYKEVTSTNDVAIAMGKTGGAEEGTLILAEHQTDGRGRYGRTWEAPHGKCILTSIIFRHRLKRKQVHLPNLIGALSIAQAIHAITGLAARIKHPNDVRIAKKKVAGVLTELEYDQNHQPFFVLGLGINVNITTDEFPSTLQGAATSLFIASESGKICRVEVLKSVLHHLEENYLHLKSGNVALIDNKIQEWEETS